MSLWKPKDYAIWKGFRVQILSIIQSERGDKAQIKFRDGNTQWVWTRELRAAS